MRIELIHHGKRYAADLHSGISLASSLGKPAAELKAWSVPDVAITPVIQGDWIGSIDRGASVNFYDIKLNPHGNGTHTEGQGHIRKEHHSLNRSFKEYHFVCSLVRLAPEGTTSTNKKVSLEALKQSWTPSGETALIIATGNYAPGHDFSNSAPPYFEPSLLAYLRENGVTHFLTDLPSVDPEEDGGALAAHNQFWPENDPFSNTATITEMLQIPEEVQEGLYLLNLQIPAIENDACPSRPVIFPLTKI